MGHKNRLGKGLDSLISSPEEAPDSAVQEIPLHKIELNPKQPREEKPRGAMAAALAALRVRN